VTLTTDVDAAFVDSVRRDPRLGWKPELPDARDRAFNVKRALRKIRRNIPSKVDWRDDPRFPSLTAQGNLGSCVPHGVGFGFKWRQRLLGLPDFDPSRLFIYYEGRKMEGTVNYDSGLYIRDGLKVANKLGAPHEELWPYEIGRYRQMPPQAAYVDGERHQAIGYESVPVKMPEVKIALAAQHFVIMGFTVYTSFFDTGSNGFVRDPNPAKERVEGGHCMDYVGYRRMRAPWESTYYDWGIFANWWDPTFGDNGFVYMKMRWACNEQYADDFWVITETED
jgi:C1A family cysteine protease